MPINRIVENRWGFWSLGWKEHFQYLIDYVQTQFLYGLLVRNRSRNKWQADAAPVDRVVKERWGVWSVGWKERFQCLINNTDNLLGFWRFVKYIPSRQAQCILIGVHSGGVRCLGCTAWARAEYECFAHRKQSSKSSFVPCEIVRRKRSWDRRHMICIIKKFRKRSLCLLSEGNILESVFAGARSSRTFSF